MTSLERGKQLKIRLDLNRFTIFVLVSILIHGLGLLVFFLYGRSHTGDREMEVTPIDFALVSPEESTAEPPLETTKPGENNSVARGDVKPDLPVASDRLSASEPKSVAESQAATSPENSTVPQTAIPEPSVAETTKSSSTNDPPVAASSTSQSSAETEAITTKTSESNRNSVPEPEPLPEKTPLERIAAANIPEQLPSTTTNSETPDSPPEAKPPESASQPEATTSSENTVEDSSQPEPLPEKTPLERIAAADIPEQLSSTTTNSETPDLPPEPDLEQSTSQSEATTSSENTVEDSSQPEPLPEKSPLERIAAADIPEQLPSNSSETPDLPPEAKPPESASQPEATTPPENNTPQTETPSVATNSSNLPPKSPSSAPTPETPVGSGAANLLGGTQSRSVAEDGGSSFFAPEANASQQALNSSGVDATKDVDLGPYFAEIKRRVRKNWQPSTPDNNRQTILAFTIQPNGQITGLRVRQTSGSPQADQESLNAVAQSAPFPPLPSGFPHPQLEVQFNFNIYLQRGQFVPDLESWQRF